MSRILKRPPKRPTLLVCNDDYTTPRADLPFLLWKYRPLMWATQESKGENYRNQIPDDRYGIRQQMSTAGTQGVSVGWDRDHIRAIPGEDHGGWKFLVDNRGMEPRGVVWQDVVIEDRFEVCLASAHRPPWRYRYLWDDFDRAMNHWWENRGLPVILGMDGNQPGAPQGLMVGRRRRWHHHRIDGVLSNVQGDWVSHVLPERTSDHPALLLKSTRIENFVKRQK